MSRLVVCNDPGRSQGIRVDLPDSRRGGQAFSDGAYGAAVVAEKKQTQQTAVIANGVKQSVSIQQ